MRVGKTGASVKLKAADLPETLDPRYTASEAGRGGKKREASGVACL